MMACYSSAEDATLGAVTSYRRWEVLTPEHEDAPLGPLPLRDPKGIVYYWRMRNSSFVGWYWAEEIAEARKLGWECTPHEGYCWGELGHDFKGAQTLLWQLRHSAPSRQVADLVKLA